MPSELFAAWLLRFGATGDICPLRLGARRDEVRAILGEPDDVGATSREHRVPRIWKYGDLELHFGNVETDGLQLIYQDDADGVVKICISRRPVR